MNVAASIWEKAQIKQTKNESYNDGKGLSSKASNCYAGQLQLRFGGRRQAGEVLNETNGGKKTCNKCRSVPAVNIFFAE